MPMHCMDCKDELKQHEKAYRIKGRYVCQSCYEQRQADIAEAEQFEYNVQKMIKRDPKQAWENGL